MTSTIDRDHAAEFERAWSDPANTAIDLPPVDVNQVLRERYVLDRELVYTRRLLWDMEVRKASAPDLYIPSVVRPGSVSIWTSSPTAFTRVSEQRLWLRPQEFGAVVEHVYLDEPQQAVYFIGAADYRTPAGQMIRAGGAAAVPRRTPGGGGRRPAGQPLADRPPDSVPRPGAPRSLCRDGARPVPA